MHCTHCMYYTFFFLVQKNPLSLPPQHRLFGGICSFVTGILRSEFDCFLWCYLTCSSIPHVSCELGARAKALHSSSFFLLLLRFIYLFSFLAVLGLHCCTQASLVSVSRSYSLLQCAGFSMWWLLLLQSTSPRCKNFSSCTTWVPVVLDCQVQSAGSVVVTCGLSCSPTCGIFLDQGLNQCPLYCKADL